ncbi:MAG: adenosylcobinamide-GDP ribazoletransferase [Xanthobacteraceae bacterium]
MPEFLPTLPGLAGDLRVALQFATRLPLGAFATGADAGPDLARASWALPVAGIVVGGIGALVYWLTFMLGLAPLLCAVPTIAATLLVTGALHEDGLADTADGFGGGTTRERKLAIMHDSRTGTYGVCALFLSLFLRAAALAVLAEPSLVAPALIAAHTAARAPLPLFMRLVQPARTDGLSAGAGQPTRARAVAAVLIGAVALALLLAPLKALVGAVLLVAVFAGLSWLTRRQIGGQTGDVAGALEQGGEALLLLAATAI